MNIFIFFIYSVIVILLAIIFIYSGTKYFNMIQQFIYNPIRKIQMTDKDGIIHKITYDSDTNHILLYTKSDGKYYKFINDKKGRLVYYEDYLGYKYRCAYNNKDQLSYYEDYSTGEKYGYSYDGYGKIFYSINYNTGVGEWYYYNENDKVYCIENSNGVLKYV